MILHMRDEMVHFLFALLIKYLALSFMLCALRFTRNIEQVDLFASSSQCFFSHLFYLK